MSKILMSHRCLLILSWVLLALVAAPWSVQASPILEAALSADKTDLHPGEKPMVRFRLINNSKGKVRVLKWLTLLEEFQSEVLEVNRNGIPVAYQGPLVKRGKPEKSDYVEILPGKSQSAVVDLAKAYDFSQPGKYHVQFNSWLLSVETENGPPLKRLPLVSNPLVLHRLEPDPSSAPAEITAVSHSGPKPKFEFCSPTQKEELGKALAFAQEIASKRWKYLGGLKDKDRPKDKIYKEWFGKYSHDRFSAVLNNYKNIKSALKSQPLTFNCNCHKANVYAYVYKGDHYRIWLCKAFWKASQDGMNSKPGTIIHEMSHFTVVAGTEDVEYGVSSCRSLAKDKPEKAIRNADNYEYCAEQEGGKPEN